MAENAEKSRKKLKRRVLIIVIAIVLVMLIVGGVFMLTMNDEQKQMTPSETGEIIPGIYAINTGFVNMFLIKADSGYIAIDAGVDANAVAQGLSQLGISSDDVAAVLLTHTHADHTAALKLFAKAAVYGINQNVANHAVADGDTIELFGKYYQVIAAPGHADDSVCYLYDGKYLFAGDNLSLKNGKVGLFNSFYNKSDEQQKTDIDKLAKLSGVEYIITAHYGYISNPVWMS